MEKSIQINTIKPSVLMGLNKSQIFRSLVCAFLVFLYSFNGFAQVSQFDGDKPVSTFNKEYSQSFISVWEEEKFYQQWEAKDQNIFTAADIANGYLQFVWVPKRIIMSKMPYVSPYIFETETSYGDGSNRGGVVIRANPVKIDQVQEPAGGDPGFNREGIAFYPTNDGSKMIVQFTGIYNENATTATRIEIAKPSGIESLKGKGKIRIEDFGTVIYVYYNGKSFIRINFNAQSGNLFTSGSVYDANMQLAGTFANMEIEVSGKVVIAQRDATLRLFGVKIQYNELQKQSIVFDPIGIKYVTDKPFVIHAKATSGLPVIFTLVKGPATIKNDTVFLAGTSGLVEIAANQPGNNQYMKADEVIQSFFVQPDSTGNTDDYTNFNTNLVSIDGAGRRLADYTDAGPRKENKLVGVFYYLWQGQHGNKVYDITKILKQYPQDPLSPSNPGWGGKGTFHFWGEPEEGYYKAKDPWVIRRNLQMLSNADVDFIFFDVTNAITYLPEVVALCEMSIEMRNEGIKTPEISFITNSKSGVVMNELYDKFYSIGAYKNLWFYWQGKPLILGKADDPELRSEVKAFFTIKFSWAWTNTKSEPNHWQWLDAYPQDWGWSTNPSVPEQLTVSVAHHPANPLGKSYSNGKQPEVDKDYLTPFTDLGLQFQEQWNRAFTVDPQVVMITQWNEWIAQRFIWDKGNGQYAGKPIKDGDTHFVDVFNREYNRDIAPMKGGYTDNYYYQMISNIRKFKGMDQPQEFSQLKSISVDGDFADWAAVTPVFKDAPGDNMHRNFPGYDPTVIYTNTTGRNDIIESRSTYDKDKLYFYVKTNDAISDETDPNWMLLFIDSDRRKETGWEGYEFVVNHSVINNHETTVKEWDGKVWGNSKPVLFKKVGNEMEISISRSTLKMDISIPEFYFKWADNPQNLKDITSFFLDGESAPDRRFSYNFSKTQLVEKEQTPYKTLNIPGTIELEDFDNGGVGVAYADADIPNHGAKYRENESVDIFEKTDGGFFIGQVNNNEWLEYTATVKSIGLFSVGLKYAGELPGSKILLFADGIVLTDTILLPATGNLQSWKTFEFDVKLTAGQKVLKFFILDALGNLQFDNLIFTEKDVVYPGTGTGLSKSLWTAAAGGRQWFVDSICGQTDPEINEVWEDVSPGCGIEKDFWNVRWQGQLEPLFTETYTFYLTVNDMGKLWVNGQLIIDGWIATASGKTLSGTIQLRAGEKVQIRVDFAEKAGDAKIKLEWESTQNPREIIPASQLYPMITTANKHTLILPESFQIYPNPAKNGFYVEAGNMNVNTIEIVDLTGNIVYINAEKFTGKKYVYSNQFGKGIYFIRLSGENFSVTKKILFD